MSQYTVRKIERSGFQDSYWIFAPDGLLDRQAAQFLARYRASTQQTYAYSLVDHLNWLRANQMSIDRVTIEDLHRYMRSVTGDNRGIYGVAWRSPDRAPVGSSSACNIATVVKAYYLTCLRQSGANRNLVTALEGSPPRQTGRKVRSRRGRSSPNPLSPRKVVHRPRFLPEDAVAALFAEGVLRTLRDVMIVTWLHDSGLRVGGLCGLRFADLHLVRDHPCGQRPTPHLHVIPREDNPNGARAKSYAGASKHLSSDGHVIDGVIRAVSPDMISTFYAYLLDEYTPLQHNIDHQQVLVQLGGTTPGAALATSGVRQMLHRAADRAGLAVRITPHGFRHKAAAALYAATGFNAEMVAQEFGWADPSMVTDLYGRAANIEATGLLRAAWDRTTRPPSDDTLKPFETRR